MLHHFKKNPLIVVIIALLLILLVGLALGLKLYHDSQEKIKELKNSVVLPVNPSPQEIQQVITKVGEHYVLPKGEPKVITITGVETLKKDQPFFEQAKDGDILLVYGEKVILYDARVDKIIDIAQIRTDASSSASLSQVSAKKVNVVVLNGTQITGLTKRIDTILAAIEQIQIVSRDNAKKRDYTRTLVIDLKGTNPELRQRLVRTLPASSVPLPEGENHPDSTVDFVIILGEDKK